MLNFIRARLFQTDVSKAKKENYKKTLTLRSAK